MRVVIRNAILLAEPIVPSTRDALQLCIFNGKGSGKINTFGFKPERRGGYHHLAVIGHRICVNSIGHTFITRFDATHQLTVWRSNGMNARCGTAGKQEEKKKGKKGEGLHEW